MCWGEHDMSVFHIRELVSTYLSWVYIGKTKDYLDGNRGYGHDFGICRKL